MSHDSSGIEIVVNSGPAWPDGEGWSVSQTPSLSVGGTGSTVGNLIWGVRSGARLSDDRYAFLVGGRDAPRVLIIDSQGKLVRSFGRLGRGPGEFAEPTHFQRLPGDTLVVWERFFGRITAFDTTGAVLGIRHLDYAQIRDALPFQGEADISLPLPDGSFIVRSPGPRPGLIELAIGEPHRPPIAFTRVRRDYSPVELGVYGDRSMTACADASGRPTWCSPAFTASTSLAVGGSPPRVYVTEGGLDGILVLDTAGSLRRIVRRDAEPVPVTDDDWDLLWELNSRVRGGGDPAHLALLRAFLKPSWHEPEYHPPFGRLRVDAEGHVWVFERRTDVNRADYGVYTPSGRWLGRVTLPFSGMIAIGDDYIIGIRRDDLDVESIHVHHLRRTSFEGDRTGPGG